MSNFMIPTNINLDINSVSALDIQLYMYNAYKECYMEESAPSIYDFCDCLEMELLMSDRETFLINGVTVNRTRLLDMYFVEILLVEFGFQYTNEYGEDTCNSQNTLIGEMGL